MIYITQGHQQSIGPEVFFKALIQLPPESWSYFKFVAHRQVIEQTLSNLSLSFSWQENQLVLEAGQLACLLFDDSLADLLQSTIALELALGELNHCNDILLTLPTSKDQLIHNGQLKAGYTEFLRARFNCPNVAMLFMAPSDLTLLVTDHIPLKNVSATITSNLIEAKVEQCLEGLKKYFSLPDEVLVAGINPHCGENGILGDEDGVIPPAIEKLTTNYSSIKFFGPYSADTLHFHRRSCSQLKVYMYHDQGLPLFKAIHGTVGLNISLGLPFLRMSVDHGTAFELYGRNIADESGALFLLKAALAAQKKIASR